MLYAEYVDMIDKLILRFYFLHHCYKMVFANYLIYIWNCRKNNNVKSI